MDNHFKNNFAELNEDKITVVINDIERTINLKNIFRIQFVKRQKYHINFLAFIISVYLLSNTFSHLVQLLISLIVILFLVASYFFKSFQYRFVVITKNHLIEIIINKKNMSKDAEEFAYQINKSIT